MKKSCIHNAHSSQPSPSWLMLTATALLLSSCSANDTLGPDSLNTGLPTAQVNTQGATPDPLQSATSEGDNSLVDAVQPDASNSATPSIGAATPADIDNTSNSLNPGLPVACSAPPADIQQRTLQLINEARAQPRNCGTASFASTTALSWNKQLLQAADKHSVDMTQHNFFDHTGSDSSTVAMRVDATGYDWQSVGENIAAGQDSASDAIAGWLSSPGHCKNLMSPNFTHVAVACIEDNGADYSQYWTNVLASPQ